MTDLKRRRKRKKRKKKKGGGEGVLIAYVTQTDSQNNVICDADT